MLEIVVPAKLVAVRESTYSVFVFKNTDTNEFIMCTKLPNWQAPEIFIGDIGFLQLQIVKAGEEYFNTNTLEKTKFLYSNIYFKNFINKTENINSEIIL
jgi:hypothetical protein